MSDPGVNRRGSVITPTPPNSPQGVIRRTPQHTPALAGVPLGEHQGRRQPLLGPEALEDDSVFSAPNSKDNTRENSITSIHSSFTSLDSTIPDSSAAVLCDPSQQEALLAAYQRHRRSSSDPSPDFSLVTTEQPRFVISSPRLGGLRPLVPSNSSSISGDCIRPIKTDLSAQLTTRNISMATKEAMILGFKLAKVKAESLLELIETTPTMSPTLLQMAKDQISAATDAYVSMAQLRTQIEGLNDVSISGDDMDELKGDLDDVKAMIRNCNREVAGGTPIVAAPTAPAMPPASHPEPRHQKVMMENRTKEEKRKLKVALDNLNLDLTALKEDFMKVTNWTEAEDHQVISGMAAKEGWYKSLRELGKKLNEQRSILETFLYAQHQDSYDFVAEKFSNMQLTMSKPLETLSMRTGPGNCTVRDQSKPPPPRSPSSVACPLRTSLTSKISSGELWKTPK